jgi:hypothetical protein
MFAWFMQRPLIHRHLSLLWNIAEHISPCNDSFLRLDVKDSASLPALKKDMDGLNWMVDRPIPRAECLNLQP